MLARSKADDIFFLTRLSSAAAIRIAARAGVLVRWATTLSDSGLGLSLCVLLPLVKQCGPFL